MPIEIRTDSDNAVAILERDSYHKSTKWLDLRYNFVRQAVIDGSIRFTVIPSAENPADALTKPLGKPLFEHHREIMIDRPC